MGSKMQVAGFSWEDTLASISASTRTNFSSESSFENKGSVVIQLRFRSLDKSDLISSVLLLKRSAKSSHLEMDSSLLDFIKKTGLIRWSIVVIRILRLFKLSAINFEKCDHLESLIAS